LLQVRGCFSSFTAEYKAWRTFPTAAASDIGQGRCADHAVASIEVLPANVHLQAQSGIGGSISSQLKKPETIIDLCSNLAKTAMGAKERMEQAKACQQQKQAKQELQKLRMEWDVAARKAAQQLPKPPGPFPGMPTQGG
jgi:hypothetical protein